jgi:hypothetical protein
MSNTETMTEDFASLFAESIATQDLAEGYVAKGIVMAIEKDVAIIDVGLKVEGRVPLKEFGAKAKDGTLKVGDEVEVYVERIENALGEAMLSREKARREESWVRLEEKFNAQERVEGVIFNQVKGGFTVDLDGAVAFLPRSQVDIRPMRDVSPLMHIDAAVPNPQDGQAPRQHRGLAPHRSRREPCRTAFGTGAEPRRRPDRRRRGQEHHRLRCVRRSWRHRRPAARHRHGVAPRQPSVRDPVDRPDRQGPDHPHQPGHAPHLAGHEAAGKRSVGWHRSQVPGRQAHHRYA